MKLEQLGFHEFILVKEILRETISTGEDTSTCCASGTKD